MSDLPTSRMEQERLVKSVYMIAADMMKSGMSSYDIEQNLVKKGLNERTAQIVVSNLQSARQKALRDAAMKNMGLGGVICLVGLIVTIGTYQAAQGGGTYVVAWGAIIFGGLRFFRGLSQYLQ